LFYTFLRRYHRHHRHVIISPSGCEIFAALLLGYFIGHSSRICVLHLAACYINIKQMAKRTKISGKQRTFSKAEGEATSIKSNVQAA